MVSLVPEDKSINLWKLIKFVAIFVAIALVIVAIGKFIIMARDLRAAQEALEARQINEEVLSFADLFIQDVLRADQEISFETRLKLENAVRDIADDEILAQWEKFVASKTEAEAQAEVKDLLDVLVRKIKIK